MTECEDPRSQFKSANRGTGFSLCSCHSEPHISKMFNSCPAFLLSTAGRKPTTNDVFKTPESPAADPTVSRFEIPFPPLLSFPAASTQSPTHNVLARNLATPQSRTETAKSPHL